MMKKGSLVALMAVACLFAAVAVGATPITGPPNNLAVMHAPSGAWIASYDIASNSSNATVANPAATANSASLGNGRDVDRFTAPPAHNLTVTAGIATPYDDSYNNLGTGATPAATTHDGAIFFAQGPGNGRDVDRFAAAS